MQKTWNMTLYRDGKPVSEQRGLSERDAVTQIYLLSRTTASVEAVEEIASPAAERELSLAA